MRNLQFIWMTIIFSVNFNTVLQPVGQQQQICCISTMQLQIFFRLTMYSISLQSTLRRLSTKRRMIVFFELWRRWDTRQGSELVRKLPEWTYSAGARRWQSLIERGCFVWYCSRIDPGPRLIYNLCQLSSSLCLFTSRRFCWWYKVFGRRYC